MEGQSQTTVKIYVETREEAEATAASLRTEGFRAELGRPAHGDFWSVSVSGGEERVEALSQRLLRELKEAD
jgi:hypothetical protein